jgi:hypothetical protein
LFGVVADFSFTIKKTARGHGHAHGHDTSRRPAIYSRDPAKLIRRIKNDCNSPLPDGRGSDVSYVPRRDRQGAVSRRYKICNNADLFAGRRLKYRARVRARARVRLFLFF